MHTYIQYVEHRMLFILRTIRHLNKGHFVLILQKIFYLTILPMTFFLQTLIKCMSLVGDFTPPEVVI